VDAITIQFDRIEVSPDRTGIEARGVTAGAGAAGRWASHGNYALIFL
jgi:hypothetical protein